MRHGPSIFLPSSLVLLSLVSLGDREFLHLLTSLFWPTDFVDFFFLNDF